MWVLTCSRMELQLISDSCQSTEGQRARDGNRIALIFRWRDARNLLHLYRLFAYLNVRETKNGLVGRRMSIHAGRICDSSFKKRQTGDAPRATYQAQANSTQVHWLSSMASVRRWGSNPLVRVSVSGFSAGLVPQV